MVLNAQGRSQRELTRLHHLSYAAAPWASRVGCGL